MTKLTLCRAINQGESFEIIKELIEQNGFNNPCENFCYPLHVLLHRGHPEIVKILKLLISKKVDLNVKSHYMQRTGLEILCDRTYSGCAKCFKMMLEHGADPYDYHGVFKLFATPEIKEILNTHYRLELLKEIKNRSHICEIKKVLDCIDDINHGFSSYNNPLFSLISSRHPDMYDIMKLLITRGIGLNIFCNALSNRPLEMLMFSDNQVELDCFELMLANGADPMLCRSNLYVSANTKVRHILNEHRAKENSRIKKLEEMVSNLGDLVNELLVTD